LYGNEFIKPDYPRFKKYKPAFKENEKMLDLGKQSDKFLNGLYKASLFAYITTQYLDITTTLYGRNHCGLIEGNPLTRPLVHSSHNDEYMILGSMVTTLGTIYLAEKVRKRNKPLAIACLLLLTALQGKECVYNNYKLIKQYSK